MLDLNKSKKKLIQNLTETRGKSRYLCERCDDILIQPCQTECGCRYCYYCIRELINDVSKCPGCDKNIESFENVLRDKAMDREISKLQLVCINENCKEIVFFKDIENHLKICNYRMEECQNCDELHLVSEKKSHKEKCPKEWITCRLCQVQLMRYKMESVHNHMNIDNLEMCEFLAGNCPFNCCDTPFERIKLHLQNCPKRPVKCLLWIVGCQKLVSEEAMDDHIKEDAMDHLNLLTTYLLERRSEGLDTKLTMSTSKESLVSNLELLKSSLLSVNETMTKHQASPKIQKNLKYAESIPNSNIQASIPSMNDGELIWTIPDIIRKIEKAKENTETEITSDAFYTDIPGYKIRLKLYPNGDGKFKNLYLSIFFIILKGLYDEKLYWPFSKRITVSLIKGKIPINSTKVIMRPNFNSACYGKPVCESNVGSGEPAFVKVSDLINSNQMMSDGSLSIKFKVER